MFEQLVIRFKTREFHFYNQSFSFFHSNSINKILTSKKIDQVILFRDLQFFDNQTEYLKRAYFETEAFTRIKKLISYYDKNMTPPSPSLITVDQFQYLESRNRKILKLCILKQKSQAQGQKQRRKSCFQSNDLKGSNTSGIEILPKLDETNLSNLADSQHFESEQESYDSDVHNVFADFLEKGENLYASVSDYQHDQRNRLNFRSIRDSQLIINFKTPFQPHSDFNNLENENPINITNGTGTDNSRTFINNTLKQNKNYQQHPIQQQNQLNFRVQHKIQSLEINNLNFNYQQNHINNNNFPTKNKDSQQSCFQSGSFGVSHHQKAMVPITCNSNLRNSEGYPQIQNPNSKNDALIFSNNNVLANQIAVMERSTQSAHKISIQNNGQNIPLIPQMQTFSSQAMSSFSGSKNPRQQSMNAQVNQSVNPVSKSNSQSSSTKVPNLLGNAVSPPKKNKISFMEYYHSIPVKNPTNILQKYVKRKK